MTGLEANAAMRIEQLDDGFGMSPIGEVHEHDVVLFRVFRIDAIDRHRANGSPRYRAKRVESSPRPRRSA